MQKMHANTGYRSVLYLSCVESEFATEYPGTCCTVVDLPTGPIASCDVILRISWAQTTRRSLKRFKTFFLCQG